MMRPRKRSQNRPSGNLGGLLHGSKSALQMTENEWRDLVRSIASGDQMAFRSLYQQTNRLVFTLILRIVHNRETADEVTLDVYHGVWRKASAYDSEDGSVIGWIMNQARSRALDRLRFERRSKRVNVYNENPLVQVRERDPQQACQLEEENNRLRDALEVLTVHERQVIETAFFSEMSHAETAAELNQPLGTIKTRIRSALIKLRRELSPRSKEI